MPYDADLRCSICKTELNMSWFYNYLEELEEEEDNEDYSRDRLFETYKKNELLYEDEED